MINSRMFWRASVVALLGAATVIGAQAAPTITPLGEVDKHGAITYSVKCDSGARKIVQCVRDDRHCGYAGDQALDAIVDSLCAGRAAEPAVRAAPMETTPASP